MANEREKGQLAEVIDLVKGSFASIARAQEERARLTATAQAGGRRVKVTVNADCVVIKLEFTDDIDDLTYSEIASAVVDATQDAAAQVQEQAQQIMTALEEEQARIPELSEFFPAMPDIKAMIPTPPVVSTEAPERRQSLPEPAPAMQFTDIEEYEHDPDARQRSSITAPKW